MIARPLRRVIEVVLLATLFLLVGGFVESLLLMTYENRAMMLARNSRHRMLTELAPSLVRETLMSRDRDAARTLEAVLRQSVYEEDVVVLSPEGRLIATTSDVDPMPLLDDPQRNRWLPVEVLGYGEQPLATIVVLDRDPWTSDRASGQFLEHLRQFVTGNLDNSFRRFIFFAAVIGALASMLATLSFMRWLRAHRRLRRAVLRGERLKEETRRLEAGLESARESLAGAASAEERHDLEQRVRGLEQDIAASRERALHNEAFRRVVDGEDLKGRIEAECRVTGGHCTFNAMLLGREIEVLVRRRLREEGVGATGSTMFDRMRALAGQSAMTDEEFDRLQRAWKVRNRVIHNQHECTRDEGMLLARAVRILRSLPSGEHSVS